MIADVLKFFLAKHHVVVRGPRINVIKIRLEVITVGRVVNCCKNLSSANLVMLLSTLFEISLIRTKKSTGPSTVPCGTPFRTLSLLLTSPGTLTWWRLLVRKLCSHSPSLPQIPKVFS